LTVIPALAYSFAAECADGEFRGAIHSQHRESVVSGDGRCIDDFPAVPALLEFRGSGLDAPEHALDVDGENLRHLRR